jgi:hypothetical protein
MDCRNLEAMPVTNDANGTGGREQAVEVEDSMLVECTIPTAAYDQSAASIVLRDVLRETPGTTKHLTRGIKPIQSR